MKKIIKAKFRIKVIQKGHITLYHAQIKTWFGWMNFWTNKKGETHWNKYYPSLIMQDERNSIDNYIASKGWLKHQVIIVPITEPFK